MAEERDFLSRWSKRKLEDKEVREAVEAEATETARSASPDAEGVPEDPDDHPAAGIDIDALDANSDFTVFMHEKVPAAIRRRALRKLWTTDPVFASLDGLNDYDEDFTDAALVVEGLKQTFDEARKRMLEREEAERAEREAKESADAPSEDAPDEGDDLEEVTVASSDEAQAEAGHETHEDLEDGDLEG